MIFYDVLKQMILPVTLMCLYLFRFWVVFGLYILSELKLQMQMFLSLKSTSGF